MHISRFFFNLQFFKEIWAKYCKNSAILVNCSIRQLLKITFLIVRSGICSNDVFNSIFFLMRLLREIWAKYCKKSAILVNFLKVVFWGFLKIWFLVVWSGICSNGAFNSFFFHLRFLEEIWTKYCQKSAILVDISIRGLLKNSFLIVRSGICSNSIINPSFFFFWTPKPTISVSGWLTGSFRVVRPM